MSLQKKAELINNLKDKIIFTYDNLFKVIKANTTNIYAFKYPINKELEIDLSISFYNMGDGVEYSNFKNELGTEKIKLKVKDIIEKPFYIVDIVDISNIYFIKYVKDCTDKQIIMKDNFNESLFNTNIHKLKDTYLIKRFVKNMSTHEMNRQEEYYKRIRAEQMQTKRYLNSRYLTADIIEMCESEIEFINPVKYIDYLNTR